MPVVTSQATFGAYRDGKLLHLKRGGMLPSYCVKCGRPADGGFVKRKLGWSPLQRLPWWVLGPLFLLFGAWAIGPFLGGSYLSGSQAEVSVPLCERHADNYDAWRTSGSFLMIGGSTVIVVLVVVAAPRWDIWLAIILAGAGALCRNYSQLILRPVLIDRQYSVFKGVGPIFLSHLPPLPIEPQE